MLRGYPGVDRNVGQALVQLSVSHAVQLHAGHRLVPVPEDAELPGDGGGGHLVIAGNHDGADAAPLGVGHGLDGLGPGRVDHGDEANEGKAVLILQGEGAHGVQLLIGESQHPQALHGQLHVDPGQLLPPLGGHLHLPLPGEQVGGAVQQHVDGSFGEEGRHPINVVEGAHQLAVGVKGQLAQTGVLGAVALLVHAELFAQHHQGHLGGLSGGGGAVQAAGQGGIVAQGGKA